MSIRAFLRAASPCVVVVVLTCGDITGMSAERACAARRHPPDQCATWTPDGGPYVLQSSVDMNSLTIEAGTVVRAAPGVTIRVQHLVINGTAEQPVLLQPLNEQQGWGGIRFDGDCRGGLCPETETSTIRHAVIEGASAGVRLNRVVIEDARFERMGSGLDVGGGVLRRVTIERVSGYGLILVAGGRVEDTTIRDSGGGIALSGLRITLTIAGGVIENNALHGITAGHGDGRNPGVVFEAPVRITGNGGYPLYQVPLTSLMGVMSEETAQQGLRGNGLDTLVLHSGIAWGAPPYGPVVLHTGVAARLALFCQGNALPPMSLRPGSALVLDMPWGPCATPVHALPHVAGTAAEPVTISSTVLADLQPHSGGTVSLRHAKLENIGVSALTAPVVLEHVTMHGGHAQLTFGGSRIADSRVHDAGGPQPIMSTPRAAVLLGNHTSMERTVIEDSRSDGVRVTGIVVIAECAIRRSAGHGVHVSAGPVSIRNCDLEDNAGDGVHNVTDEPVHAADNWWGDPAGPHGPAGDGVAGAVLYMPFRTAPVAGGGFLLSASVLRTGAPARARKATS